MTPIVAVVGRPNVGTSTLFTRLAGKGLAIVDDPPGVTRERHSASAHLHGRNVTLVDTGGFDPESDDPMQQGIARHVRAAIEEADVIVCVLDALVPPTQADLEAVRLLRRSSKPVVYVANKLDQPGKLRLGFAAAAKQHQRWNAANAEARAELGLSVGIDLRHDGAAYFLSGQLLELRSDGSAGATPGSPKIDQDRRLGVAHQLLEVLDATQRDGLGDGQERCLAGGTTRAIEETGCG